MKESKEPDRGSGYSILRPIVANDRHRICRARGPDGTGVLLKFPERIPARPVDQELLRQEFELLQGLACAGTPRPVRFTGGPDPKLVLEDCPGVLLRSICGAYRNDLDAFFAFSIRVCRILADVHRNGIVHRGLSPDSLLVDTEDGGVTIVDFGLATQISRGNYHPLGLALPADALPYFSPEQTGRMNREVDHRTDLYALGATLYELLAGVPPFYSHDLLEVVHWHIAKEPPALESHGAVVPEPVSSIIFRLLAKTPEERYQSAAGVLEDLETCRRSWSQRHSIPSFPLGRRDVSDRFLVPQRLFGRERELRELSVVFEHACAGSASLILVAGYSGIGKTSLIQELYRPIVRFKAYFISGKVDQVARGIPYGPLISAFRELASRLSSEGQERVGYWRSRLSTALGSAGGVLTEVIPELEAIIGPQTPAPAVGPAEAQNRFQRVFRAFIGSLTAGEHPLVLFLDDLQWVDQATLDLLEVLLTAPDIGHLLVIGAYRDNEVDSAHRLRASRARLAAAGTEIYQLTLGPLPLEDLTLLVSEALLRHPSEVRSLAELIRTKTDGNPFFVNQFLKALWEDGLLAFDSEHGCWTYDPDAVRSALATDNVLDLMIRKIRRLSSETQRTLSLAACVGNRFDVATMALVTNQSRGQTLEDIKAALEQGLLVQLGEMSQDSSAEVTAGSYGFLHDRVQQAAYALIPDGRKEQTHLEVGRRLFAHLGDPGDDRIFDMVGHLNIGAGLITSEAERLDLVQLNLDAARRAKSSTAYQAALGYARAGMVLLEDSHWRSDYGLTFSLHFETAECAYLCGLFDVSEQHVQRLLERAGTRIHLAEAHHLRLVQNENRSRYGVAVTSGRNGLAALDVELPETEPGQLAALEGELESIAKLLGDRTILSLADLPETRDPEKQLLMRILTSLWAPAYITANPDLARLISATIVRLSLEHGSTPESAYGYVTHAITVGPVRGDFSSAYEWGRLALAVNERFQDVRQRAKIHQQFHAHVSLWRRPLGEAIPHAREARRSGLENGDLNYAAYGAFTECWPAFLACPDLGRFIVEQSANEALLVKMKMEAPLAALRVVLSAARALRGETVDPFSFSTDTFDEGDFRDTYGNDPFFMTIYCVMKLGNAVTFADYDQALRLAVQARSVVHALPGTIWPVLLDFYRGMTLAVLYPSRGQSERDQWRAEWSSIQAELDRLAASCPENFACYSYLLRAEIARAERREQDAVTAYEGAMESGGRGSIPASHAMALERSASYWSQQGDRATAAHLKREATRAYSKWGAIAKVQQLEAESTGITAVEVLGHGMIGDLDLRTVMKAGQAISQEIEHEALIERLMQITMENAGAERGLFFIADKDALLLAAESRVGWAKARVFDPVAFGDRDEFPRSVVLLVHASREGLVVGNAVSDDRFHDDPFVRHHAHLSILCVPVMHQGALEGVLYMDNALAGEAFTAGRMHLISLLASQAAISLANARLYREVALEAQSRRQAEETLRSVVEGTASVTGQDFFRSLVRQLASGLGVRHAFVTECVEGKRGNVRMLAFWQGDEFGDCSEYDTSGTPCRKVVEGREVVHSQQLQTLFPEDRDLVSLGAESYLGVPMVGAAGAVIGHLVVLDDRMMQDARDRLSVLRIFAARGAAELERLHAEHDLREALLEIENLKNRFEAENVYLQEEIRREHNFEEIVGSSPLLLDLLAQVGLAAPTDSSVLIYGETGTGKELIARAIHNRSTRRDRPLVKVNCGAIAAGLVESELFGHVRGAFTGAVERRTGRFELANGGTIFLDEVGELPLEMQVKLLRVLQEQEFEPVGSSRPVRVDVRLIAATNRDLVEEMRAGRFREDLYYRLNVLEFRVPPLRDRPEDIPLLISFFLSRHSRKVGKEFRSVASKTMESLRQYPWPGNIRELQNVIERAVVLLPGPVLSLGPNLLPTAEGPSISTRAVGASSEIAVESLTDAPTLVEVEVRHITQVLEATSWVIEGPRGAAGILKLHPNTLRSRMKKLGIRKP